MPECQVDGRPTDTVLCPSCTSQVIGELRRVEWLAGELHVTLTRQARTGDRNGPRSSERPLPYDQDASVDLDTLRGTLQFWADEIAGRRSIATPFGDAPELARWLQMWPSEIAGHPDAAEMHEQILSVIKAGERTIDRRPDLKFVGPCDGHGAASWKAEDNEYHDTSGTFIGCGQDMYAHLNARAITCRTDSCGAAYNVEQRRAWLLEAAADQLRTAKQISDELPWIAGITITSKVVGMWAVRGTTSLGKLHTYLPHPKDPRGAQRFRVGEVIDYARAMAAEKQQKVSGAA